MKVSLSALRAFESAARHGSFKLAAAELAISPTAVSHHIGNLEQRLSVNLFIRRTRKVELTQVGMELAAATRQGFQTIEAAIEKIALKSQDITISTTSSFAALVLIPALKDYYDQYPNSKVNVVSGEAISQDNFALSIRFGDLQKQAISDVIKKENFNLYCSAQTANGFEGNEKVTIYTTDWKNKSLPDIPLKAWLVQNQIPDEKYEVIFFDQELFGIQQALQNNAYVFCSKTLAQGYLKTGMLLEMDTQAIDSQLCYYIRDREGQKYRNTYSFINWLENLLSQA